MRSLTWTAAAVLAGGLMLGACGGDDDDDAGADGSVPVDEGTVLEIAALDRLRFDPVTLAAPAGSVTIDMTNEGGLPHSLVIEGVDDFRLLDDDRGTVELAAGEYVFFCDIPGHRDGGMEGTLSVS